MRKLVRAAAAALTALGLAATVACSSGGDAGPTPPTELTPAQRLAAARTTLDQASSVHLKLTSSGVPKGASGIVSADGHGAHPPAFKGIFKVVVGGVPADAEITAVGGEVWAKLPLIPGTNKIDPKTFGLPDPATLFSTDKGLTTLLPATKAPVAGEEIRQGADVLTPIKGTVPGADVVDLFLIGDRNGTFEASYGLTEANELRQVALTGPFFGPGTTSTYTLALDEYNQPVTITKP